MNLLVPYDGHLKIFHLSKPSQMKLQEHINIGAQFYWLELVEEN